jgi:hypothetical protein
MKRVVLAAALLVAPIAASAADRSWSRDDVLWEIAFAAEVAVDWSQTRWMIAHPEAGLAEANPLLGRHPSRARVNAAGLIGVAAHAGVAHLMPNDGHRRWWQVFTLTIETLNVGKNFALGARFAF